MNFIKDFTMQDPNGEGIVVRAVQAAVAAAVPLLASCAPAEFSRPAI